MFNSEPQETWTKEDAEEFERYAVAHLKKMWMSAAWAGAALLMNILCVVPFLYGWPLHSHWDVIGKYLILTAMALLLWVTYRASLVWSSWQSSREIYREFSDRQ